MAEFKDLQFSNITITRTVGDEAMFNFSFTYRYAGGTGTCNGMRCKDESQCLDNVKMLLNNKWPG